MTLRILSVDIRTELDVVSSRQRARQIAALCGFGNQDQIRIATAVSEMARNVYNYAPHGRLEFSIEGDTAPQVLFIRIQDEGPGIANLDHILKEKYQSSTGLGLGISGARRLMDQCEITTAEGQGTTIILKKLLPPGGRLMTPKLIGDAGAELAAFPPVPALSELQQQNRELLETLAELKTRQEELLQLTRELEDTNRGVVALYAELDEKADHLRRADEMKSRFLSNMSHEFRTPLSSIRALAKLLLDRTDGELTEEQEKQVTFILKGAESLSELVNDLLDLAKIEAGKIEVRPVPFTVTEIFSALRGMLRPLLVSESVTLVFEDPAAGSALALHTDEAKVSQILRNFISNALKFTETGEVRVTATALPTEGAIRFSVSDTGVGIAPELQQLVFEEFTQVENKLQHKIKGTGLGLPLCRRLAGLLGGRVELVSTPGEGSIFSVVIPVAYPAARGRTDYRDTAANDCRLPVLVVEDHAQTALLYEEFLQGTAFRPVLARSIWEAEQIWKTLTPVAVVLDIVLNGEDAWRWLASVKSNVARSQVPLIVATEVDDSRKGFALGADAYFMKPVDRIELVSRLESLTGKAGTPVATSAPAERPQGETTN